MPDNKQKQGASDDRRVDPNDAGEVRYAARRANQSPEMVRAAVEKSGDARSKLRKAPAKKK